jgi:hypothetical protein
MSIPAIPTLALLLEECENDTKEMIGQGAANRLARWRQYAHDEEALVAFVQRVIHGGSRANGWKLDQHGRLSLERIVLDRRPDLFTEEDKRQAKETLGIQ